MEQWIGMEQVLGLGELELSNRCKVGCVECKFYGYPIYHSHAEAPASK